MFRLLPLVSEHTIKIINYFKNQKVHFRNLLGIPGELPLEKLIFQKIYMESAKPSA